MTRVGTLAALWLALNACDDKTTPAPPPPPTADTAPPASSSPAPREEPPDSEEKEAAPDPVEDTGIEKQARRERGSHRGVVRSGDGLQPGLLHADAMAHRSLR